MRTSASESGLETQAPEGAETSRGAERLARGTTLGRYVVLDPIGKGGMGVVVSAYDPELDRKVAIKLLRWTDREAAHAARGAARLLREAQALAKLAHANVVAVHDVGTVATTDGVPALFVAMELLDGDTVAVWLERERPGWRAVLDVFVAAGRGLEAAHAAGVIHRDFKPENVLVTASGRVVVLDFGIARAARDSDGEGPDTDTQAPVLEPRLTLSGAVMGTPAFMSPEQAMGHELDPATDQFSFCASLYLGLYGELPYATEQGPMARAGWDGELRALRGATGVPTWLRAVVARGLARDPSRRFDSMTELLEALSRDPSLQRRRLAGFAAVACAIGATWFFASRIAEDRDTCALAVGPIDATWAAPRRAAIGAALADGTEIGDDYARRVLEAIDAHTTALREQRLSACRSEVPGRAGAKSDVASMIVCLDRAHDHLQALVSVLEQRGGSLRAEAMPAVTNQPNPSECGDVSALRRMVPVPDDPQIAAQAAQLRLELVGITSYYQVGDAGAARDGLVPVLERIRALGYEPLVAEALIVGAGASMRLADYDESIALAEEGYRLAEANGVDAVALEALGLLTLARTTARPQLELAEWHSIQAEALVHRLGDAPDDLARVLNNRARLARRRDDSDTSVALLERAEALLDEAGIEDVDRVVTLDNLGSAHFSAGRVDEARSEFEHALAIADRVLGPQHNLRVNAMLHLGQALAEQGNRDGGLAIMRNAEVLAREVYGAEHPTFAALLNTLGMTVQRDDPAAALPLFAEAQAILEVHGPESSRRSVVGNYANALLANGDAEGALAVHRRLAVERDAAGDAVPLVRAKGYVETGVCLRAVGDLAGALGEYGRARALLATAVPAVEEPFWLPGGMARVYLEIGAPVLARAEAERAVVASEADRRADAGMIALERFTLARALRDGDRDRSRSVALAVAAIRTWSADPRQYRTELADALGFFAGNAK